MFGDAIAVLYIDLWYRLIPYGVPLIAIGLFLNIIAFITGFWIPESPAWLISQGRIEEATKAINRIAKFNGITETLKIKSFMVEEEPENPQNEILISEDHKESATALDDMRNKSDS